MSKTPDWFRNVIASVPQRSMFSVGDATIEIERWGAFNGPPLLLLHGHRASASWWHFTAPLLANDHDVTAISFSGMGGSSWRPHYSVDIFRDEARAAIDRIGANSGNIPIVIGHSLGGHVGAELAHLDDVSLAGLIIIEAGPISSRSGGAVPAPGRAVPSRLIVEDSVALRARFRPLPAGPEIAPYILDYLAEQAVTRIAEGWSWRFDPALPFALGADRAITRFCDLRCRVAQIHGALSPIMGTRDVARFLRAAPLGTPAVAIPSAGHHVPLEQPLAMVAAIRALLATHFAG